MSKKRKREDEQVILTTVSAYTISCNFFKHFRFCTCVFSRCSLFIIVYLHQQFLDVRTSFLTKEMYKKNVFVFGMLKLLIIKIPNSFRLATYVMLKHYNPRKAERFQGQGVHQNQRGILQVSLSISL